MYSSCLKQPLKFVHQNPESIYRESPWTSLFSVFKIIRFMRINKR